MIDILAGTPQNLADVPPFIQQLATLNQHATTAVHGLFAPGLEIVISRAPGRLDVMGGIADYSGSLVLQLPIREATLVALQKRADAVINVISLSDEADSRTINFAMPLTDFVQAGQPIDYAAARAYFQRDAKQHWAAYVAGTFLVLMRERGFSFEQGANILISSEVPEAMGVSSSAALEVAVMQAVAAAFDLHLEPRELALLCQMVENLVVGAPCGVMDQMAVTCGNANQLMALRCQPAELQGDVALPDEIAVWGLDSGVRHAVSGADYGSVRVGAFMGYRILADLAGMAVQPSAAGDPVHIIDTAWGGYLANVTPAIFETHYAAQLPKHLTGAAFLQQYGNTTDLVTTVEPTRTYAVLTPTAHPIYEHFRVQTYAELLRHAPTEQTLQVLGELMYQSHASYSACGLGSAQTDRLVELVRQAGPTTGVYGAKITGGGSGGTVAILGRQGAADTIQAIADRYMAETGHQPHIFAGSSPGVAAFGVMRVQIKPS